MSILPETARFNKLEEDFSFNKCSLYNLIQSVEANEVDNNYSQLFFAVLYDSGVQYLTNDFLYFQNGDIFNDKILLLCSIKELKNKTKHLLFYFIDKAWFETNLEALKKGKIIYFI